jgi:thymidylate synthase (FAD)
MHLSEQQAAGIDAERSRSAPTRRPTVTALEELLYRPQPVLDHGFVRVIDYMGDDAAVVQAARVSYGRGTRHGRADAALIRYLIRHRHTTPFEMCEIKYHIKLPIFVARQWIRHRTASVNEISARYSILDREFYLPAREQLATQATDNRQGRADLLGPDEAAAVLELLREDASRCHDHYELLLNQGPKADPSRRGLARELARINLTLATYTQWYWKIDLHNLLHFLSLRLDAHAQYEIRAYAEVVAASVRAWVPESYAAFADYRLGAVSFSAPMLAVLRRMLAGEAVTAETSGLGRREWQEMMAALGR